MYIKKEAVDELLAKAQEKLAKADADVTKRAMMRFEDCLDNIAQSYQLKEGDTLDATLMTRLFNEASLALGAVGSSISRGIRSQRNYGALKEDAIAAFNPHDSLMSWTDYLYAKTMQKLGSPNIPASFGPEMQRYITTLATSMSCEVKLEDDESRGNSVFFKQRRQDANVVAKNVSAELSAVKEKKASARQVEKLASEYRALKKRQEKHGAWWRAFHSGENKERKALLAEMKSALQGMLGQNVNPDTRTPFSLGEDMIRREAANATREAFSEDGMSRRVGVSADLFEKGEGAEKSDRDSNEMLRDGLKQLVDPNLKVDVQPPQSVSVESPIKTNSI